MHLKAIILAGVVLLSATLVQADPNCGPNARWDPTMERCYKEPPPPNAPLDKSDEEAASTNGPFHTMPLTDEDIEQKQQEGKKKRNATKEVH
ncbi:MAG TPA: hypothetical protein VNN62_12075 [Methylomirabilota bacterium]|nr:hypothetical protein [Methylomirabilota bacterium]